MLQLLSGHYPTGSDQIAVTPGLASELNLAVGDIWPQGGKTVVGIVQNPQSLLDEFALVPPGQVTNPTQVSVLFDAPGVDPGRIGSNVTTPGQNGNANSINPDTIVLALATVGMLLIALVSIGGFTVLAQRRMRALGMLESMGATDRNVRLVLEANGVIVGARGRRGRPRAGLCGVGGLPPAQRAERAPPHRDVRPALERDRAGDGARRHRHLLRRQLPGPRHHPRPRRRRPGRAPRAAAPDPPLVRPRRHRTGIGFVFFSLSGAGHEGSGVIWLIPGFIALVAGSSSWHRSSWPCWPGSGGRSPIAIRLPLRDMARYRARSGSALSAISVGVLIAVIICAVAVARYSNVFDYVGPNLAANQLNVYSPPPAGTELFSPGQSSPQTAPAPPSVQSQEATVSSIARPVGATHVLELVTTPVGLQNPSGNGRQWNGPIYVATPALLRAYGIDPSSIPSNVDILSSRPGLSGSGVQLTYGGGGKGGGELVGPGSGPGGNGGPGPGNTNSCSPGSCVAHPLVLQEESRLPTGTSAPNTRHHRERVAPAARGRPEQPGGMAAPGQRTDQHGPDHERPSDRGHQRLEH